MEIAIEVVPPTGQDRAAVYPREDGFVVALADGAGGTSGGASAATAIVEAARGVVNCRELIDELDRDPQRLGFGLSTAVVIVIEGGASVGDSGAWVIHADRIDDLTHAQRRKPFVGAGAEPVEFGGALDGGTLLVASDGRWSYAKRDAIARIVREHSVADAAKQLVDLVRLPTGELQDDVSIVLVR